MVATNPEYFGEMWNTASGKHMVYLAFFLQVAGGCWLYRLTRLR
jgi:tight adherence protein B